MEEQLNIVIALAFQLESELSTLRDLTDSEVASNLHRSIS